MTTVDEILAGSPLSGLRRVSRGGGDRKVTTVRLAERFAELDGALVGYAYAGPYRARPGYRFTCENSIYIRHGLEGRGIGKALLAPLISGCEAMASATGATAISTVMRSFSM